MDIFLKKLFYKKDKILVGMTENRLVLKMIGLQDNGNELPINHLIHKADFRVSCCFTSS